MFIKIKKGKATYLKVGVESTEAPLHSPKCRAYSALLARGRLIRASSSWLLLGS
jgi:hypothetical protein